MLKLEDELRNVVASHEKNAKVASHRRASLLKTKQSPTLITAMVGHSPELQLPTLTEHKGQYSPNFLIQSHSPTETHQPNRKSIWTHGIPELETTKASERIQRSDTTRYPSSARIVRSPTSSGKSGSRLSSNHPAAFPPRVMKVRSDFRGRKAYSELMRSEASSRGACTHSNENLRPSFGPKSKLPTRFDNRPCRDCLRSSCPSSESSARMIFVLVFHRGK